MNSLRDRIIQSASTTRSRLLREKEQLDIADSNALLLNPSQFSIGNPSSPGGALNPRKTRNTRLRPGEADEPASLLAKAEEIKRKRKAAFDNDDNGSPGPASRNNGTSANEGSIGPTSAPYKDARRRLEHAQFEAPLYSVDRLFSDKELSLNMDRAHLMTAEYFARLRAQGIDSRLHNAALQQQPVSVNGGAASEANATGEDVSIADPDREKKEDSGNGEHEEETPSTQQQIPVNTHTTRSAHRAAAAAANPLNALSDLATVAAGSSSSLPSTLAAGGLPFGSNAPTSLPPYSLHTSVAALTAKSNASAPPPPTATDAEIAHDILMMKRGMDDPNYEEMLKRSVERPGLGTGLAMAQAQIQGQTAFTSLRDELAGGVEMKRGGSAMGGVAMSRGPSLSGYGADMRRTTSARGG